MNYSVVLLKSFRRDLKTIKRKGYDLELLYAVTDALQAGKKLSAKHKEHNLVGKYRGFREYHITSDWLLIYKISEDKLFLLLSRTGTHSDFF